MASLETSLPTQEAFVRLAITIQEQDWRRFYPAHGRHPDHNTRIGDGTVYTYADWLRFELDHHANDVLAAAHIVQVSIPL